MALGGVDLKPKCPYDCEEQKYMQPTTIPKVHIGGVVTQEPAWFCGCDALFLATDHTYQDKCPHLRWKKMIGAESFWEQCLNCGKPRIVN